MNISEKKENDVTILNLDGTLMGGPEAVSLNEKINRLLDEKSLKVVLNLEQVERDEAGDIGLLLNEGG